MSRKPLRKRIKYTTLYFLVRFFIFISGLFPRILWLKLCGFLGSMLYYVPHTYRKRSAYHLKLALGKEKSTREIIDLTKQMYKMLGKNTGDLLRSCRVKTLDDLNSFLRAEGTEHLYAAQAKGKGVIVLSCHLGAYDLQAISMGLRGIKLTIIGTPLQDERLNSLLYAYRHAYGTTMVERGREIFRLIRVLKKGEAVVLLIDQDTKVKSRFVNFFGMPAATPIGVVMLALKTGAAVVPSYMHLDENHRQVHQFFPEIQLKISDDKEQDIIDNTQTFTRSIEDQIRKYPAQWVWMHERWKTKPGEEIR